MVWTKIEKFSGGYWWENGNGSRGWCFTLWGAKRASLKRKDDGKVVFEGNIEK